MFFFFGFLLFCMMEARVYTTGRDGDSGKQGKKVVGLSLLDLSVLGGFTV